jgi:tetratricopeptide (TPR) repeat protein
MTCYHLGNLLYDKQSCEEAIRLWEIACGADLGFATPWRNLGLACFNRRDDGKRARECYAKAAAIDPNDGRILYEADQLEKRLAAPPAARLSRLEKSLPLAMARDSLAFELVQLYILTGQYEKALGVFGDRRFHPWEGGEGRAYGLFAAAHVLTARGALEKGDSAVALAHLGAAHEPPESLGEGALPDARVHYFTGLAKRVAGEDARADFEAGTHEQPGIYALTGHSHQTYYRALSLRELGRKEESDRLLEEMLERATRERDEPDRRYFYTSVPGYEVFRYDPSTTKRIDCGYLIGLAALGLGREKEADEAFRDVLSLHASHIGAHYRI